LRVLFQTAAEAQAAADEAGVLEAIVRGLARAGLNAHAALRDPGTDKLVVQRAVLVPAHTQAAVEARLGRPLVGIELHPTNHPYDAVVSRGDVVWLPSAAAWLGSALPWLDRRTVRLFARLRSVGQGVCAPVTDGTAVLGALSVWGEVVTEADVPTIALLGRHAGGALAALRLRRRELDRARLDGVLLAARTATHVLSNHLMLTVGSAELIARSPDLPPRLRSLAELGLHGAVQAAEALRQLQGIVRVEEIDHGAAIGTTLDLNRSSAPPSCH
jgi:hypothetical protein